MIDPAAHARLDQWKRSLLDLSAAHRLLDSQDGKDGQDGTTTIALPSVDPVRIAAALADGAEFSLESGPPVGPELSGEQAGSLGSMTRGPGETARLRSPLARGELARRLVAMRRAARGHLADGEHGLWLGLGLLTWCDGAAPSGASVEAASTASSPARATASSTASSPAGGTAPLVLWPVELERVAGGAVRLVEASGVEPQLNLVLIEKLRRDFDVVLAAGDALDGDLDIAALLEAAEAIAVTRPGWRLERAAQLGIFAVAKLWLWHELETRGDELLRSPLVARLARAGEGSTAGGPVAAKAAGVGDVHDAIAPLDADASQLAAIAAAGRGTSFVLQGPPGTGKSQTIANLIVHCVSHGKTVLFVAGKRTALEVVQQRLAAVGLGELCLELHAHKAARAGVVAQLGRVLERAFRPLGGPTADDRLTELRAALDGHVAALHRTGPLGRSLHEVLGRLVELRPIARAALAERDAAGLDRATFERRKLAVDQLAAAAVPVEPVAGHPWRASTLEHWPAEGGERVRAALDEADHAAGELAAAVDGVASLVPGLIARTREQLQALGALAALAAASPRPGAELLTQLRLGRGDDIVERIALIRARGTGNIESPRDPASFLVLANRHGSLATEVNDRFTDSVAELDAHALWTQLRRWAHRVAPLRFLALREVRAQVRAAAMPGMLETDGAMITALESVIAERAARAALVAAAEPARRWFGELGGAPLALDLSKIDAAVGWAAELRLAFDAVAIARGDAGRAAAWRTLVAQVAANPAAESPGGGDLAAFARLATAVARWRPALAQLVEATGIELATLGAGEDHLAALRDQIERLRHAKGALGAWVAFHAARQAALAVGVRAAVAVIERGELGAGEIAPAWERATLLAWADAELAAMPALARFHGAAHHAHVAAFADLDRATLALGRTRALVRHAERVPRSADAGADTGGELAALLHEVKKPRGHRALRRLFRDIPALLPRLAPCLVMSPAAVAQYLDPALPRFDVVVFDEASRLATAEAIAALARGEAAVVVGDSRQLPPALASSEGPDSVLDDAIAAQLPELRLAWHYGSKHEDLIAFASQRTYGDRLQVLPAAQRSPDLGVSWRRVDGIYDRAAAFNRSEAEAVASEVLTRLRDPAQRTRSIGVVAWSRAQQALIEDLLDAARADDPDLDELFEPSPQAGEPVLVETVDAFQGDERDVVIASLGYGPDATGALPDRAEPPLHGERRLAVAITRAREQLVVFSSFAPEDVVSADPALQGLAALIAFARSGGAAPAADAPPASPITAAIARGLVERGWTVRHQVGCGPYRIDLAVVDPSDPEHYVLAIEHDGASYAGAPAARDRDRLRPQLLGQLGWRLHRVWTLDWWTDPDREIQRAHGAIIAAVAASRQRRAASSARPAPVRSSQAPRAPARPAARPSRPPAAPRIANGSGPTDAAAALIGDASALAAGSARAAGSASVRIGRIAKNTIAIGPYLAAAIPAGRRAPDDLFAPRHAGELGKIIDQVLAAEAPMHLDVLARRVAAYFGIGRPTQRVIDQVRAALAGRARWDDEDHVVWRLDQDPAGVPAVRVAGQGASARRAIEEVPLCEVAAAARIVVERAATISPADLVRDTARLLGFARITDRVVERVASGVRLAAQRELIRVDAGKAMLPE